MRKEPFSVGSYVHVLKRGTRGMPIVRDEADRWRFLKLLRYLNDENVPRNWERDVSPEDIRFGYRRPGHWPEAKPYVSILAFCLMDNHFHLLLRENTENGIARYMQRLCTSMALYYNTKYEENGTLFQGAYKARTVEDDEYLQHLSTYIQVKNPFELYDGGIQRARKEFAAAWEWALQYPFASLRDYSGNRRGSIVDHAAIQEIMPTMRDLHARAQSFLSGELDDDEEFIRIAIDI